MIREYKETDREEIIRMSEEFWKFTAYKDIPFDSLSVSLMIDMCTSHKMMSVLEVDGHVVGFACGVAAPMLANINFFMGVEIAYWIDEPYRGGTSAIKLMRHLEASAKKAGVTYWNMNLMHSSTDKVGKLYERMGYTLHESSYGKRL